MEISNKNIKMLKGLAHHLNPVVHVGKASLSEALIKEAEAALEHHQLIKVRMHCDDKEEFQGLCAELAEATESHLVQALGRTAVFYRAPKLAETKVKIKLA